MRRAMLEPAWLLHVRPFRDTSLLIEAYAREHGRIGLVARGARGSRSRWRGLLQPFHPLLLSWSGRGELVTLTGAEATGKAGTLDGDALLGAYYLNELLLRLLARNDPHPGLFDAYSAALNGLHHGAMQASLRVFEKRLLDELGYGLQLGRTADTGEAVSVDGRYRFDAQRGPLAGDAAYPEVGGATLLALADERLEGNAQLREARVILRQALDACLGSRPLRTREAFAEYRKR